MLAADVEALESFFLGSTGGLLDEAVVRSALAFLKTLGDNACGGGGGGGAAGARGSGAGDEQASRGYANML